MSKKNRNIPSTVKSNDALDNATVSSETVDTTPKVETPKAKTEAELKREATKDVFVLFTLFVQRFFAGLESVQRHGYTIETKIFSLLMLWAKEEKINFVGRKGTGFFGKNFIGIFEGGREVNADTFYIFLNREAFEVSNALQSGYVASTSRTGFCYFDTKDVETIKGRNVRKQLYLMASNAIALEKQEQEKKQETVTSDSEKKQETETK